MLGDNGLKGLTTLEELHEYHSDSSQNPVEPENGQRSQPEDAHEMATMESAPVVYKTYKRRWFGLAQLVLLNIIVSWDWLTFSASSKTSASYYNVSESDINWISTGFLFAFCVAAPFVIWILNKGGPKPSIIIAAALLLVGNWVRYIGTVVSGGIYGVVMLGQVLIGLAQPFVLAAPTRYSDLWFTDRGRISATAVASLANPFGGAFAQLIDPFLVSKPHDVPRLVLVISIISSIAALPSFFIPARPPTPPSISSSVLKTSLRVTIPQLAKSTNFYLIFIPFSVYVGFFNSFSTLINQFLEPYDFSETDAGITGGLLIIVGLISAAITSPLVDRFKCYLLTLKILVPVIALCYLTFIWAPPSGSVVAPYLISAVLGAASFSLVPVALEYLVEIIWPISPEVSSTFCWTGGQLLGAIFIIISDALREGEDGSPPLSMKKALIFQAVVALAVVPLPLYLGWFGSSVHARRLEVDKQNPAQPSDSSNGSEGDGIMV
ncbi:MAG: hypothetical protein M1834_002935 [Cirrosporium novae-zelandiae]|nr:MAG: hypothetical protein M1834_002935 [Cirrosporium novae-zelandiae]